MRFTTNAYPRDQRLQAWRFTLQRCLIELTASGEDVYGEVMSFQGNDGIGFWRLTGTAQSWVMDGASNAPAFWMLLVLDGRIIAKGRGGSVEVQEGASCLAAPPAPRSRWRAIIGFAGASAAKPAHAEGAHAAARRHWPSAR
jgi:hypothetical protein